MHIGQTNLANSPRETSFPKAFQLHVKVIFKANLKLAVVCVSTSLLLQSQGWEQLPEWAFNSVGARINSDFKQVYISETMVPAAATWTPTPLLFMHDNFLSVIVPATVAYSLRSGESQWSCDSQWVNMHYIQGNYWSKRLERILSPLCFLGAMWDLLSLSYWSFLQWPTSVSAAQKLQSRDKGWSVPDVIAVFLLHVYWSQLYRRNDTGYESWVPTPSPQKTPTDMVSTEKDTSESLLVR